MIYQLCTNGELPFKGDSLPKLYTEICSKDYLAIPNHYSSNLCKFVDKLLRKNAKNRPTIGKILIYLESLLEDSIVSKAGKTMYPSGKYESLCQTYFKPLNGLEWFYQIANNKILNKYMKKFGELYMKNLNMALFISVRDDNSILPNSKTETKNRKKSISPILEDHGIEVNKPEPLLSVLDPKPEIKNKASLLFSSIEPDASQIADIPKKYQPTKTGALLMRIEANRIRTDVLATTNDPITRNVDTTPKFINSAIAPHLPTEISPKRTNLDFNFMRDHDLNGYFKIVDPEHRNLPEAQQGDELLKAIKAPLSDDENEF